VKNWIAEIAVFVFFLAFLAYQIGEIRGNADGRQAGYEKCVGEGHNE
jgi:hypothetical protein